MALTLPEKNKMMYVRELSSGKTHDQIINNIPKGMRERFIKDINKTYVEIHFGVTEQTFLIATFSIVASIILFTSYIILF